MEALAQRVQDALPGIAVYLGSEYLAQELELPHVIVLPGDATYIPPDGRTKDALASVQADTAFRCRTLTFEDSVLLAEACYAATAATKPARIRLDSEPLGDRVVRVATLTITLPAVLTRSDVTRVRIEQVLAHHRYLTPPQEAPDEQTDQSYTATFE